MNRVPELNLACVITRKLASDDVDELGNEIPAEEDVEAVCELQQSDRDEPASHDGSVTETLWDAFFPAGTLIDAGDLVTIDGVGYQVHGAPWHARNRRTQVETHVEATLKRTVGVEEAS